MAKIEVIEATIASGQSLSSIVDLGSRVLVAIQVPAWTQAQFSFFASHDGSAFGKLTGVNQAPVQTAGDVKAGDYCTLATFPEEIWKSVRWLRIQSGAFDTPVNQGGERTLYLVTRADAAVLSVSC